jgi:hypothetical protein
LRKVVFLSSISSILSILLCVFSQICRDIWKRKRCSDSLKKYCLSVCDVSTQFMNEQAGSKKNARDNCTISLFPERSYDNDWFFPSMKHIFFSLLIAYHIYIHTLQWWISRYPFLLYSVLYDFLKEEDEEDWHRFIDIFQRRKNPCRYYTKIQHLPVRLIHWFFVWINNPI